MTGATMAGRNGRPLTRYGFSFFEICRRGLRR
jgi:hypothetical protein